MSLPVSILHPEPCDIADLKGALKYIYNLGIVKSGKGTLLKKPLGLAGGQSTPSKGNLGAAFMRRFNSSTPAEQPRRSIFRAASGPFQHQDESSGGRQY